MVAYPDNDQRLSLHLSELALLLVVSQYQCIIPHSPYIHVTTNSLNSPQDSLDYSPAVESVSGFCNETTGRVFKSQNELPVSRYNSQVHI